MTASKATKKSVTPYQKARKESDLLEQLKEVGLPTPRSLTYGEMEEFEAAGLDPLSMKDFDKTEVNTMMRWILKNVYGDQIQKDHPWNLLMYLAAETFAVTYGTDIGRKN